MMRRAIKRIAVVLTLIVAFAATDQHAYAYERELHEKMSGAAFQQALAQRDFAAAMGIEQKQPLVENQTMGKWMQDWVKWGSYSEDDFPRSRFHFFDPLAGKGLGPYASAPIWALGLSGGTENLYSIPKAREEMYRSLTEPTLPARQQALTGLLRRIGHMVHLIQDMAQPQHVRDDPHFSIGGPHTDALFTDYSRYERFTQYLDVNLFSLYPAVQFSYYQKYWKEGGKGLAEFTNANFVSEDTNFKPDGSVTNYPSPSIGNTFPRPATKKVVTLNGRQFDVPVRYLGNTFTDRYIGQSVTNDFLTAHSIFDFVHEKYKAQPVYTLTDDNHNAYADHLIPRAVGYSAGLINYFFRGRMEISLPEEHIYSLVDHAAITSPDQGFTKIKLKLKNTTPDIVEPDGAVYPQHMTGGTLVAVAKYHRNGCYRSDLSGEFLQNGTIASGCDIYGTYLSGEEQISVSAKIENITLNSNPDPKTELPTFTFDFSQNPIPVNARDVYLQVVYRGLLGSEVDGVAVVTKDISEPTYIAHLNSTDFYWLNNAFYRPNAISDEQKNKIRVQCVDVEQQIAPELYFVEYRFGGSRSLASVLLSPERYSRIVVLVDRGPFTLYTRVTFPSDINCAFGIPRKSDFNLVSVTNQTDSVTGVFYYTQIEKIRGLNQYNFIASYKAAPDPAGGYREPTDAEIRALESFVTDQGPYQMSITF